MFKSTTNSSGLSVLAKGKGLLNGGVEIECIPDYRHSHSLSGKKFLTTSSSVHGSHASVCKPYSLVLPKTYVTRRGQMMLFTAPEDMILGQKIEFSQRERQVDHLSRIAVKELKTVDTLCKTMTNYEDPKTPTVVKPGCFTSVYLKKLRSVQTADEKDSETITSTVATPTPELAVTESDSGIDSSVSHQTLNTSGRMSSLSNRTESGFNIIVPDGTQTIGKTPTLVRFNEDMSSYDGQSNLKFLAEKSKVESTEITDIMFSIPQSTQGKNSSPLTNSGKKGSKKKSSAKGKKHACSVAPENVTPNATIATGSSTKKKGKSKKKSKRQKECTSNPIIDKTDTDTTCTMTATTTNTSTVDKAGSDDGTSQATNINEHKKTLQSAKAHERRLAIEKKRLELEEMRQRKKEEEEKQLALKQKLEQNDTHCEGMISKPELSSDSGTNDSTNGTEDLKTKVQSLLLVDENVTNNDQTISEQERKLREAFQKSREARERNQLLEETKRQQEQEINRQNKKNACILEEQLKKAAVDEVAQKLKGHAELNYKMKLELMNNKQSQRLTSHFFSYFSYMPKKPANKESSKKRNVKVATKRKKM